MDYLISTHAGAFFGFKEEIIQALNIVVDHYSKSAFDIFSVGVNKHFELVPVGSEKMSFGVEFQAIRGFFISVRFATSRLLFNVHIKHAAYYNEGLLNRLILIYFDQNGRNMVKLGNFLKRVRVQITYITRKNKAGREIPRIKIIVVLATSGDDHNLPYLPIVPQFAVGAKEVKFFRSDSGDQSGGKEQGPGLKEAPKGRKSKKLSKAGPEPPQDSYISIFNHFHGSEHLHVAVRLKCPRLQAKLPQLGCAGLSQPILAN
jgi:hypothetical protein